MRSSAGAAPEPTDEYLLGDSPPEIEHLLAQAEVYAPEGNALLDSIGLRRRAHAVDVGCGVLGLLHLLSERVGPRGRVVGLDRERRILEMAAAIAARREIAVELLEGDATRIDLPSESFDLVHARTLLLNVADPERALAEMSPRPTGRRGRGAGAGQRRMGLRSAAPGVGCAA
jgi:SAM-dependent methyltransferase